MTNQKFAISNLLRPYRREKGAAGTHTHTRIPNQLIGLHGGSYDIPEEKTAEFHKLYMSNMFDCAIPPTPSGDHLTSKTEEYFTEKQLSDNGPILIDIDFRYQISVVARLHTPGHIDDLVSEYAKCLTKMLDCSDGNALSAPIPIYIMEKPTVRTEADKTKDGIHIVIGLRMDKAFQLMLREKIIEEVGLMWEDLPITNTWADAFDEGVVKGASNWQMYGSKKPGYDAYRITRYYSMTKNANGTFDAEYRSLETLNITTVFPDISARNTSHQTCPVAPAYLAQYNKYTASFGKKRRNFGTVDTSGSDTDVDGATPRNHIGNRNAVRPSGYLETDLAHIVTVELLDEELAYLFETNAGSGGEHSLGELSAYTMVLPIEYWGPGTYTKWWNVGLALFNTDRRLFLVWVRMSAQSHEFNFADIPDLLHRWNNMPTDRSRDILTSRSIIYWARESDPEAFKEVHNNMTETYVQECLRCITEVGIARLMYHKFKYEWVFASHKGKIWYKFENGRWRIDESGTSLRKKISDDIHDLFLAKLQVEIGERLESNPTRETIRVANAHLMTASGGDPIAAAANAAILNTANAAVDALEAAALANAATNAAPPKSNKKKTATTAAAATEMALAANDEPTEKKDDTLVNKLGSITERCRRTAWKENIMKETQELFYDREFIGKLDNNPNLLCFNNGIVDFTTNQFREGRHDDYVSLCCKVDYMPLSSLDTDRAGGKRAIVREVKDFIAQLFPNDVLREYMWDHLASILIGRNDNNVFNIYNGSGCNGKSKMVDLLSICLGDYKGTVPITLVTSKRNGIGGTSSEVAQLKGLRYAVMQEPSVGDKLNEGMLKELTGGDPIQARALYVESVTFIPQFKLAVCTNTNPDVDATDDGTWRRMHVTPFESKFCEDPYKNDRFPEADYPHQFAIDKRLGNKFLEWAPVMMAILVDRAYVTKGLVGSNSIVESHSDAYRRKQDCLLEFVKEKIQELPRLSPHGLTQRAVRDEYKNWYANVHGGKSAPRISELSDYLSKKYSSGKYPKRGWRCIKLRTDDETDDEFDEANATTNERTNERTNDTNDTTDTVSGIAAIIASAQAGESIEMEES